jgi:hypothetical protein
MPDLTPDLFDPLTHPKRVKLVAAYAGEEAGGAVMDRGEKAGAGSSSRARAPPFTATGPSRTLRAPVPFAPRATFTRCVTASEGSPCSPQRRIARTRPTAAPTAAPAAAVLINPLPRGPMRRRGTHGLPWVMCLSPDIGKSGVWA